MLVFLLVLGCVLHPHGCLRMQHGVRGSIAASALFHTSCASCTPPCLAVQALRQMGLEGVLVLDVPPGTPADKAGLKVGWL